MVDGLCIAARNYDPNNGAFSTIAMLAMGHSLWRKWRDKKAQIRADDKSLLSMDCNYTDNQDDTESTLHDCCPSNEISPADSMNISDILSVLNDREKEIAKYLYLGHTYDYIANIFGVSVQRISQIVLVMRKKISNSCIDGLNLHR